MSRSFHVTRRDLKRAGVKAGKGDLKAVEAYNELCKQYSRKHRAKRDAAEGRSGSVVLPVAVPRSIPIEIKDHSNYLHYPACAEDIYGLLNAMPQGLVDGLSRIILCLGKQHQSHPEEDFYSKPEADPYLGRLGYKVFAGIYRPRCLGVYLPNRNEIRLNGYVHKPSIADRPIWDFYLRLHMLGTFIHELAHHYDFVSRIARGRWRWENRDKLEIYAETMAYQWVREYVIPFVKERYSHEYEQLNRWMMETLGLMPDLELLVGDCRSTAAKGRIYISNIFDTSSAFEEFVQDVLSRKDLTLARIEFARELHFAENYDLALRILDKLLEKDRKNIDALGLYGDILVHQENYTEAVKYAQKGLQLDKRDVESYLVLCDSYEGLKDWKSVIKWATCALNFADGRLDRFLLLTRLTNAEIQSGLFPEAEKSLQKLKDHFANRRIPRSVSNLEKLLREKIEKI